MLQSLQYLPRSAARPLCEPFDIFISIRIDAEVRRVLQALAEPEYMESWIQIPGSDRVECHADGRAFDRFRLDLYSSGKKLGAIDCACHLSMPNKVMYLLECGDAGCSSRSIVEIRLWGEANACALRLRHSGFQSDADKQWSMQMWEGSLRRLSRVLEGAGAAQSTECHPDTQRRVGRLVAVRRSDVPIKSAPGW
jgi:uncharacterized protein YndB with AHSA1/START domain